MLWSRWAFPWKDKDLPPVQLVWKSPVLFKKVVWTFADAMDILDQETAPQELDYLLTEGVDIAFYSRTTRNLCNEIAGEIWRRRRMEKPGRFWI